jgi:hypothetical protein
MTPGTTQGDEHMKDPIVRVPEPCGWVLVEIA